MRSKRRSDGHFLKLEDVRVLQSEFDLSSSLTEELMLHSEEFFCEFIEDLEIKATCADCGRPTLAMLLHDHCSNCFTPASTSVDDFLGDISSNL